LSEKLLSRGLGMTGLSARLASEQDGGDQQGQSAQHQEGGAGNQQGFGTFLAALFVLFGIVHSGEVHWPRARQASGREMKYYNA